jgi:hypothetical protein
MADMSLIHPREEDRLRVGPLPPTWAGKDRSFVRRETK